MWFIAERAAAVLSAPLRIVSTCTTTEDSLAPSRPFKGQRRRDEYEASSVDAYDAMRSSRVTTGSPVSPDAQTRVPSPEESTIRIKRDPPVNPPTRYPSSLYDQFVSVQRQYSPRRVRFHGEINKNDQAEAKEEEPRRVLSLFPPKFSLTDNRASIGSETDSEGGVQGISSEQGDVMEVVMDPTNFKQQVIDAVLMFNRRFHYCHLASLVMAPFANVRGKNKISRYVLNRKFLNLPEVSSTFLEVAEILGHQGNDQHWHSRIRIEHVEALDETDCERLIELMWHNHTMFQRVDRHLTGRQLRRQLWRCLRSSRRRCNLTSKRFVRPRAMTIKLARLRSSSTTKDGS